MLLADRDPEEARKLLDPVLERMMEAVHRQVVRANFWPPWVDVCRPDNVLTPWWRGLGGNY
jgi:hypothetical protein